MSLIGINEGTATFTPSDTVGTVKYPIAKIDVGAAGSTVPWQGTVVLGGGTLSLGTVTFGTNNINTLGTPATTWGTVINTGTSTLGTLKALVAGSAIWITDLTISVGSASNVALYSGGTANVLFGTVNLAQNGGVAENFRIPLMGVSGSAITYTQSANGPMSISAQGYVV